MGRWVGGSVDPLKTATRLLPAIRKGRYEDQSLRGHRCNPGPTVSASVCAVVV